MRGGIGARRSALGKPERPPNVGNGDEPADRPVARDEPTFVNVGRAAEVQKQTGATQRPR
jgi:hypothetical protein